MSFLGPLGPPQRPLDRPEYQLKPSEVALELYLWHQEPPQMLLEQSVKTKTL